MLFKSEHMTQVSGSIAGVTYSHNRGGLYRRARSIPVDPGSAGQIAVRAFFGALAALWSSTLTEAQRTGWRNYSAAVPLPGPLGTVRDVGGESMYIRCNSARLRAALARVDTPPAVLLEGDPVLNPVLTAATISGLTFAFTNPAASVEALLVQQGTTQNAGVNFFKGPFRFAGSEAPPLTPFVIAFASVQFPFVAGQKVFARVRYSHSDGRLGPASIINDIAA